MFLSQNKIESKSVYKFNYIYQDYPAITTINNSFVVTWGSPALNQTTVFLRRYTLQDLHLLSSAGDGTPLPVDEWINSTIVTVNSVKALPYAPGTSGINPATFEYSIDSGAWQQGDEVSFFTEGARTVSFRAQYPEGGYCQPASTEVMMDVTAPLVDIDVDITATSMTFTATADDILSGINPETWFYSVDSEPLQPGSSVTIPEVRNCEIYFEVRDNAGNYGTAAEIIVSDIIPPVITATGVEWTNDQIAYARATAVDLGAGASGINPETWYYRIGNAGDWIHVPGVASPDEEITVAVLDEGITTVSFMVSDHAGNTAEAGCEVKIDRTPPGIFPGIVPQVFVQDSVRFRTVPFAYDSLSGLMAGSLEYSLDTYDPGQWHPVQQEIDVSGADEGDHTLYFRAEDECGNTGIYEEGLDFVIDRTDPVLETITIRVDGRILEEHEYSPEDAVVVTIDATDTYGQGSAGIIRGFSWITSDVVLQTPGIMVYHETDPKFTVKNLENGLNYLYVVAIDAAGNRSEMAERIIRVDTVIPGEPVIESLTHPEAQAEEDAVALSDAVFVVIPGTVGLSGVDHYSYELKAGTTAGTAEPVTSGTTTDLRIELPGLDDNAEGEFYFLSVTVAAGNGEVSPAAVYTFRIDTTPPQDLTVQSTTHSKPDTYYASGDASFSWNRPLDFTGISSYYYTVSTTPVLPGPVPDGYMHSGEWTATELQAVSIHLPGITDPPMEAGQVFFAVCAEDYSGNRQYDEISILFDTVKPWIDGDISVIPTVGTRSVYVSWPVPDDNIIINTIPQVSHSEVKLSTVEPDGTMVDGSLWMPKQMNENQEHEFTGLSGDLSIVYAVTVKVIDKAGNEMQYSTGFRLDGETVELAVPFTEIVGGIYPYPLYPHS